MIKTRELVDPNGCMVRAKPDEMVFVLLARDASAPNTIRFWVERRIATGKNKPLDPQIVDALACADFMEKQREHVQSLPDASSPYVNTPATAEAVYAALRKHERSFTTRENVVAVLNALARVHAARDISDSPTKETP